MDQLQPHRALPPADPPLPAQRRSAGYPAQFPEVSPAYSREYAEGPDTGGAFEYWRMIRRRKGTLILFGFLGAMLGILITLPQTPVYQARTSLEIQDLNENFMNMKQVSPVADSGTYTALSDIQTQIRIIQSDSLLNGVVKKLKLKSPADLKQDTGRISSWRRALNLPEPAPIAAQEQAVAAARGSVKARAAGQTRIIDVLVDSTDPKLAADFANTLANQFIDQNIEARWNMAQRTGEWLGRQLDEMRIKLERSEDSLQQYAQKSGLMFTDEKTSVSEEKLRQLQTSLSAAQADRAAKQSRYEIAKTTPPESLADILNDTSLRNYQEKITALQQQEADFSGTYTAANPRIKKVEAQVAALETALKRESSLILKRIQNDYQEAVGREKLLTADYANQARILSQENERSIQYNILKREVDSNRQLYDAMLSKVKEASVASAMRASNVRVVDPAQAPGSPYKPRLSMNTALGLFAGLFLGVVFVVMRERADRTIQEPGDAPYYLDLPELGVIPATNNETRRPFYYIGKSRSRKSDEPASAVVLAAGSATGTPSLNDCIELVTWERKPSVAAESFRAVLTSILFSGKNGDRPKVLVMTSPNPAEGKTTVTCNLAIALAEINQRVLLIDGDLRKPRIHEIFQISNEHGLRDLLMRRANGAGESIVLNGSIRQTSIPGLSVLPSGPATSSAANLLYSSNLRDLIGMFRSQFDTILIDTPPMLQMPDARVVGRLSDAVILVIRGGKTTRDAAVAARQRFSDDNTNVLGTILNGWDPKTSASGYYKYYNGYYKPYGGYSGQTK